jgi:tight adherence protein B
MRCRLAILAAVLTLVLALASPAFGVSSALVQNVDTSAYPDIRFTLVVSPDAVAAPGDVPVVTLTENGKRVADISVSSLARERQPIDVVLLMDASGSMAGQPLADAKDAARRFVESMERDDRIAVMAFSTEPVLLQGFTSDRAALFSAIDGIGATGETALYDGLVSAAGAFASSTAVDRYIVALSDGGDTMSISSPDNAASAIAAAQAPVYAVALESPEYNPATLETIAQVSGGRMTSVAGSGSLAEVYQSIAEEMQLRYQVTYRSGRPNTPELELLVAVGSGEGAKQAEFVTRNPRFQSADWTTPLSKGRPSIPAFGSSMLMTFGATVLIVLLIGLVFTRDQAALDQLRFYDQLRAAGPEDATRGNDGTVRGAVRTALEDIAERRGFTGLIQQMLDKAGVSLRANEYIFFHVLGTVIAGVIAQFVGGGSMLVGTAAVLLAVVAPLVFLRLLAERRLRTFNDQLPDILDLIAGSLRSGWGVQQSIDLVVDEVGEPARSEFRRTQSEARLGLPLEEALERMAARVGSDDLHWVVTAISIQREVGGNLAEVLNTVSHTIRERAELRRQVVALTAEGRLSLWILSILPFFVFALMLLVNREYMVVALQAPIGIFALAFGGVLLLVGIVWLNRVMKIEV